MHCKKAVAHGITGCAAARMAGQSAATVHIAQRADVIDLDLTRRPLNELCLRHVINRLRHSLS